MGKIFKRGLIALAPVAISIAVIVWLLRILEGIFRVPLQWMIGKYYFPGMGLMIAFVFIFIFGIFVNNYVMQKMTALFDRWLARIPFFKTIYSSIGDMMSYFQPKDAEKGGRMVVVEVDSLRFLAILTRENLDDMPEVLGDGDRVTVFIPFSYQIGGFTTTVPRSKIKSIDMTVEQGMRFIVTAGMVSGKGSKKLDNLPGKD